MRCLRSARRQCLLTKIVSQSDAGFDIEGPGGSEAEVDVRFVQEPRVVSGADLDHGKLRVRFPAGEGYRRVSVRFMF